MNKSTSLSVSGKKKTQALAIKSWHFKKCIASNMIMCKKSLYLWCARLLKKVDWSLLMSLRGESEPVWPSGQAAWERARRAETRVELRSVCFRSAPHSGCLLLCSSVALAWRKKVCTSFPLQMNYSGKLKSLAAPDWIISLLPFIFW